MKGYDVAIEWGRVGFESRATETIRVSDPDEKVAVALAVRGSMHVADDGFYILGVSTDPVPEPNGADS